MANENSNVVVDRAQSHWSDLWKKEDYWAIWLGFALLIAAICIFINGAPASYKETIDKSNAIMKVEAEKAPFKTIAYIQAQDAKKGVVGTNLPIAKEIKAFIASPGKWTDNPVKSMFTSQAEADAKNAANKEKAEAAKAKAESSFAAAQAAEKLAADAGYNDASLNTAAEAAIKDWTKAKADASKASAKAKPVNLFTTLPLLMVAFALFFGIGIFVMGQNLPKFLIGFVGLFVVVPHLLSIIMNWIGLGGDVEGFSFHIWDGLFKFLIFIGYIVGIAFLPDIRRVFCYHGAEHKTIHAYESGDTVTPESAIRFSRLHPRCGTTFLLFVMSIAILLHTVLVPLLLLVWTPDSAVAKHLFTIAFKLLLMVPISALSYELIRYAARLGDGFWGRILRAPGMFLQLLTTREPELDQVEVAVAALASAVGQHPPRLETPPTCNRSH